MRYYALVAPLMMEHLKGRPVALVRAPTGIGGELFFQKHAERYQMPGIEQLDPAVYPGHPPMLEVAKPEGLLSAAQMNVIEFHTWNGVKSAIDKPDRMTFDLDPGEGVGWAEVQEAAQLVRAFLEELGLPAFLKTSGGKGLHVVVPLKKQLDWDTVKDFSQAVVQHLARTIPQRFVAKSGRQQPRRQDLHRLPAQRLRRDDGVRLVGARAAGPGHFRAGALGRARRPEGRRPLDGAHRAHAPGRGQRAVGGLRQQPGRPGGRDEGAGFQAEVIRSRSGGARPAELPRAGWKYAAPAGLRG